MKNKVKTRWYMVVTTVIILIILTFTPAVIPYGQYKPELFGIPYTLWTGILVGIALVGLTIFGSFICPGSKRWEESQ
jgi:membrane protease YdiL (CAAX protease family)